MNIHGPQRPGFSVMNRTQQFIVPVVAANGVDVLTDGRAAP